MQTIFSLRSGEPISTRTDSLLTDTSSNSSSSNAYCSSMTGNGSICNGMAHSAATTNTTAPTNGPFNMNNISKCFNMSLATTGGGGETNETTSAYGTTVRKSSQNEIELAMQQLIKHHNNLSMSSSTSGSHHYHHNHHYQYHHLGGGGGGGGGGLGKTKKSHLMHTHYCKSKSITNKGNTNQTGNFGGLSSSPTAAATSALQMTTTTTTANGGGSGNGGSTSPSSYFLPPKQTYQVGPYLSPPVLSGRRASDGGSNISLFNQIYSLRHSHKHCNDNYADNVNIF